MEDTNLSHNTCSTKDISKFNIYKNGANNQIGIQCKTCASEWLSEKCVTSGNGDGNTVFLGGIVFHPFTNRMYCDPDYRIKKDHVSLTCFQSLHRSLKRGDHICYKPNGIKGLIIIHHAIIEAVSYNGIHTKVDLIHWKKLKFNSYEICREENVDLSSRTDCVERFDYGNEYVGASIAELTLARAKSLIGRIDYNVLTDNCEHFAIFCKIGTFYCWQLWYAVRKTIDTAAWVLTEVSHTVTGVIVKASKVATVTAVTAAKQGVAAASRPVAEVAGEFAEVVIGHGNNFLSIGTQVIGFGVVVGVQVLVFSYNVCKLRIANNKGEITNSEFREKVMQEFIISLERVFYTGVLPMVGMLLIGTLNPCTGVVVGSLIIGAIAGGAICWYARGFDHTFMGRTMSLCTKPIVKYKSSRVHSVIQLSPGDHLVVPQWILHPRCHVIVIKIVCKTNAVEVIRFTYGRGVVKEMISIAAPSYKVIYEKGESFDSDTVIQRATGKIGCEGLIYHILENNCKSFARWCKTGERPSAFSSIGGYTD